MLIDNLTVQKCSGRGGLQRRVGSGEQRGGGEIKLGSLQKILGPRVATSAAIALIHRRMGDMNAAAQALMSILSDKKPGTESMA